jgi:hypothetical protein
MNAGSNGSSWFYLVALVALFFLGIGALIAFGAVIGLGQID